MRGFLFAGFIFLSSGAQAANRQAKIMIIDENGDEYTVALDAKGIPRLNGEADSHPTIKILRNDSDLAYCHEGDTFDVEKLVNALVDAADKGDTLAELVSIVKVKKDLEVTVSIRDEAGPHRERFLIETCDY